jgi:hypothetical protein
MLQGEPDSQSGRSLPAQKPTGQENRGNQTLGSVPRNIGAGEAKKSEGASGKSSHAQNSVAARFAKKRRT